MYTLKALCAKAYQELLNAGLKEKTVYGANWYIWNRLIRKYGEDEYFIDDMVYSYCMDYFGRDIFTLKNNQLVPIERRYKLAFNNLIQSGKDLPFNKVDFHFHRDFVLSNHCKKLLDDYIIYCKENGNSNYTLSNKFYRIKNFIIDVDFENITVEKAKKYLTEKHNKMNKISYAIEIRLIAAFILFAYQKDYVTKDIYLIFPRNIKSIGNKTIPSTYSPSEIRQLLSAAYNYIHEDNHLRNYAILCLIVYSGIRAADVVNMTLKDIDWRNNQIDIIQHKTKRRLTIPLIAEIGNPILNYITKERVKGETLFTSEKGKKLITQHITSIINVYFQNSGINIGERHYGAHSLRHSIATNLLNKSVDMFSIANVLGHSNIDCVGIYAKVDLINLRKCVLEAPYSA